MEEAWCSVLLSQPVPNCSGFSNVSDLIVSLGQNSEHGSTGSPGSGLLAGCSQGVVQDLCISVLSWGRTHFQVHSHDYWLSPRPGWVLILDLSSLLSEPLHWATYSMETSLPHGEQESEREEGKKNQPVFW
jgi:hypothetical protein